MADNETFGFNHAVLLNRIEEIKRNPPPDILAYKHAHPEFKTVACELLAEYADVSVSTLKNLKLGKLTDCTCSTLWLLCRAFEIDPADLLNLPRGKVCNPASCGKLSHEAMESKQQRIADLSCDLGAARSKIESLQESLNEKNAAIAKRDHSIKFLCILSLALVVAIVAVAAVCILI